MPRQNLTSTSVVSAAADLADRSGYDAVSVSALARELGVQPASLYSHVRDRAAVLESVHQLALDELADTISSFTVGRSGREALSGLIRAHRDFAAERPGRWTALQRPATEATATSEPAKRVGDLMRAVLRGYDLPDDEFVHATRFVGATVNGFLTLEAAGSFSHRPLDTELSWDRALAALDGALTAWPTTASATADTSSPPPDKDTPA